MTTTPQQLDDIADRANALAAWDQALLAELYPLLIEPFQTIYGFTLRPYQPGVVTDNLYRLRPRDWARSEQDLGSRPGSVAGFSLWRQDEGEAMPGLKMEMFNGLTCPTLAIAMLAATAKVWAYILRQAGRT
jgi:hypothetical protein